VGVRVLTFSIWTGLLRDLVGMDELSVNGFANISTSVQWFSNRMVNSLASNIGFPKCEERIVGKGA